MFAYILAKKGLEKNVTGHVLHVLYAYPIYKIISLCFSYNDKMMFPTFFQYTKMLFDKFIKSTVIPSLSSQMFREIFFLGGSMLLIFLVFCDVFLFFVLCPMLPISLDYSFSITPLAVFNVYLLSHSVTPIGCPNKKMLMFGAIIGCIKYQSTQRINYRYMTNPWQDYWKEMEQLKTNKNMKWSEEGLVTCDFSVGCTLIITRIWK